MGKRSTTQRDRDRATLRRSKGPCHICGHPIDYALHYLDPMAFVADHIIPLNKGGADVLDNKGPAHRICNRLKSDKLADEIRPRTFVTRRTW